MSKDTDLSTKTIRIWDSAHEDLEKLARLMAPEKKVRRLSMTEAASEAIREAVERRQRKAANG